MAHKKGKDSLWPSKQHARRRRVVHVFTEGKVTEPTYIEIIRARGVYTDQTTPVEVRIANATAPGSQRTPIKLVEAAVRLIREETREAKRSQLREEFWPQVWCMFDRDQHEFIDQAMRQAHDAQVRIAFSHPCFEVWRLLHHKPVTGTFGGVCDNATERLPFVRDAANIKVVLPDQIELNSFATAKKHALQMNAVHGDHVPLPRRDPYTDVFNFVENGLGISSY